MRSSFILLDLGLIACLVTTEISLTNVFLRFSSVYDEQSLPYGQQEKQHFHDNENISRGNSSISGLTENLAWASVQLQCLCQLIESSGKSLNRKTSTSSVQHQESTVGTASVTSLHIGTAEGLKNKGPTSENVHEVASTSPKILFCDLYLLPGECRTFTYEEVIPSGCPSTYHGKNIRFYYRLVVAAQRVGCPIATLRLPIRVLSPFNHASVIGQKKEFPHGERNGYERQDEIFERGQLGILAGNNKPAITNPFASHSEGSDVGSDDLPGNHEDEEDPDGLLSSKMALLLHEPTPIAEARKKATHYDIKASEGRRVGKLCLFKTAYKLGEDILGLFDFSETDLSCLQYSVSLIGEEKIPIENEKNDMNKTPNIETKNQNDSESVNKLDENSDTTFITKLVSKQSHQEFCFGFDETSFSLPVPLHVTPTFKLPECQLSWTLRFEFVICATRTNSTQVPKPEPKIKSQPYIGEDIHEDVTSMGHEWNGPSKIEVETMTWNLPIILLPSHPQIVASAVPSTLKCSMTI